MNTPSTLSNSQAQYLIEPPEQATSAAVIFLPGISGGAFTDRFLPLVQACHVANMAVARVEIWKDSDDANTKSFADIHGDLLRVIAEVKNAGYTSLYGIGKSFGGAAMLTLRSPDIEKKVLWAPAIGATEGVGTYRNLMQLPLSTFTSLIHVTLDRELLSTNATPTLFIHGTVDTVIPLDNSRMLVSMMPHASLAIVEGADHSYKNPKHEAEVIDASIQFLA